MILKLIDTVSIGKVKILKNISYLCHLRLFYIVYSANPDEMSQFATIHLGHEPVLPVSRIKGLNSWKLRQRRMRLGLKYGLTLFESNLKRTLYFYIGLGVNDLLDLQWMAFACLRKSCSIGVLQNFS